MSENLPNLFTEQFSANIFLRLQQLQSKLRGKVMEGQHVGKAASPVNYIGPVQLKAPAGRFAPLNRQDPTFMRRWVFPQPGEIQELIDNFDQLQTIVQPQSQYVTASVAAIGRGWDDAIIAAAFGTAQTGGDTGLLTAETFAQAGTNVLASTTGLIIADTFGDGSTSVGMTIPKLVEADRIFRHVHVDESEMMDGDKTIVIGSAQYADLLNLAQVQSNQFNPKPVFTDGKVTSLFGFNIVTSERLGVASSIRSCIAFVRSGLYLGIWKDTMTRVDQRIDLSSMPWQIYANCMFGATRLEPGRVLQVKCADAYGADITP